MRKIYPFLIVLLSLVSSKLLAQYDTEVDFGLRVKYGITRFSEVDKKEVEAEGGDFEANSLSFGGFLQLRVNHFYFQPELVYNRVSTGLGNDFGPSVTDYSHGKYEFTFNSIELPLLLGYRTSYGNVAMRFGGGPMFSYLMSVEGDLLLTRRGDGSIETRTVDQDELDSFNDITLGARIGIGADIGPFIFDIMYERAFSKVGEEIVTITPVIAGKENSFLIAIGYKLIRTKR